MPNKTTSKDNLSQPRIKAETKALVPHDANPPPDHILHSLQGYETEGPFDPFAAHVEDRDHVIPLDKIAQLARGDFPNWSALDKILMAIIRANPKSDGDDRKRLKQARTALLGPAKRGRRGRDDRAMLEAMAHHYVTKNLIGGIAQPQTEDFLDAVLDKDQWPDRAEGGKDHHQWKALRKRLSEKFDANKELYLAAATASTHPEQQKRWDVAKQIIALLHELELAVPGNGSED